VTFTQVFLFSVLHTLLRNLSIRIIIDCFLANNSDERLYQPDSKYPETKLKMAIDKHFVLSKIQLQLTNLHELFLC